MSDSEITSNIQLQPPTAPFPPKPDKGVTEDTAIETSPYVRRYSYGMPNKIFWVLTN